VIAQNDNYQGGDSLLHCRLPETGQYMLEVRDKRYAGDPRSVYCVEITNRPKVYGVFPLAVQNGHEGEFQLVVSRPENVADSPGTATWKLRADAQRAVGWRSLRPQDESVNPIELLFSPHPQISANGENNLPSTATPILLPCGVSGRFLEPGQTHYYRFDARKDHVYRFEVQSQRRGWAVDSVIEVLDASGASLATADDGTYTKDARLHFRAPRDGTFLVTICDVNRRAGDRYAYHLSAEPSGPDFEVHGEFYYGMAAAGGQAIWFVRLKRMNGFDGPVEIMVDNLPRGMSFTPVTIPPGMNHCGLIFSAAADAKVNASLVRVRGRAKLPRLGGMIDAVRDGHVTCELRRAGASRFYRSPIQSQLLAVTKPLDLTRVEAKPAEVQLRPGGKAEITLRIERSPEYSDQVLLDMAFSFFTTKFGEQLPPGVTMSADGDTKLTGHILVGKIVLQANKTPLMVKRLPIAVLARVPITYSIMTNYASNPIYLTVSDTAIGKGK
jgi:hypothetical protein